MLWSGLQVDRQHVSGDTFSGAQALELRQPSDAAVPNARGVLDDHPVASAMLEGWLVLETEWSSAIAKKNSPIPRARETFKAKHEGRTTVYVSATALIVASWVIAYALGAKMYRARSR